MSEELPPQDPVPDVEEQLGQAPEPQQEEDQTDVTEGDADERISDLEERVTHVENVADVVAQSVIQEPFGPVFPARFDTSGNFQEQCVVNGSISDMIGGRSNSGWTGIPLGAGQGLVVECEDYDASNSRSKMQFLLLGANTNGADIIPVNVSQTGGSAGSTTSQCTFTYTVTTLAGATLGTVISPVAQRPALGKMTAANIGTWVVSTGQLWWCDEVPAVTPRVCP